MTPEEEAYAEALRRIREAQETGADALDLIKLSALNRLPQELVDLTKLQSLNLSWSWQLSDFSPLTRLTSLRSLDLSECTQLRDLSPLAGLTSLQELNVSLCVGAVAHIIADRLQEKMGIDQTLHTTANSGLASQTMTARRNELTNSSNAIAT